MRRIKWAFYLLDFLSGRHLPSFRRLFPEETVTRDCSVERRVTNREPRRSRERPNLGPGPVDWVQMPLRGWHVPTEVRHGGQRPSATFAASARRKMLRGKLTRE
jgi:hypothetical protein